MQLKCIEPISKRELVYRNISQIVTITRHTNHNSGCNVSSYCWVDPCFLKAALLYQLKNVYIKISNLMSITPITLVQSNESDRYQMDHNICSVAAPKLWFLKFLCILVCLVQTFALLWSKGDMWPCFKGTQYGVVANTTYKHLLQWVHTKHHTLYPCYSLIL